MTITRHKSHSRPIGIKNHSQDVWEKKTKKIRAVYLTKEWRQARADFLEIFPYCNECGAVADTVDHIKPHRGDIDLFWDSSNWQPLCFKHHQRKRGRERHIK